MPVEICLLNLDRNQRELRPHGSADFPCAVYSEIYSPEHMPEFPWHWHEEMELLYISSGCMELRVPGRILRLKSGAGAFINSGILHYGKAAPSCGLHSLVFSPLLVSGSGGSAIDRKYIQPLIHCAALPALRFGKDAAGAGAAASIEAAFTALKNAVPGAELAARAELSRVFLIICRKYRSRIAEEGGALSPDSGRVRKMMNYIHEHYAEPLSLAEIAASAAIGGRECLRCFKRSIQIPPLQYVIMCRLRQSAQLLENSAESIADIAYACGFASPASFTQLFRRYYGSTPREYRQRCSRRMQGRSSRRAERGAPPAGGSVDKRGGP